MTAWRPPWNHLKLTIATWNTWPRTELNGVQCYGRVHVFTKERRTETAVNRRGIRKGTLMPPSVATIPCPHYPRLFRAKIGLTSHLRNLRSLPERWSDGPHRTMDNTIQMITYVYVARRDYKQLLQRTNACVFFYVCVRVCLCVCLIMYLCLRR